jgi:hypothetical protein
MRWARRLKSQAILYLNLWRLTTRNAAAECSAGRGGAGPYLIALLAVVTILGAQAFDTLAASCGGEEALVSRLDPLFDGIASRPAAPEF